MGFLFFFFFSSRRRHTRFDCDWSSDVCSSDLFLEREGNGKVGALSAIRAPKIGKSLPKPIQMAAARRLTDADERAGETRDPWILARDAAVMALLYGSGLRISEAL